MDRRLPVPLQVSQRLRERIEEGFYSSGEWLPTERDLARELGVSRPVIRAAISHLIEQGWIARAPGCRPRVVGLTSLTAGAEASSRSSLRTIAAILPQRPTYVSAHAILRGINEALRQKEAAYHLAVCDTHPSSPASGPEAAGAAWERCFLERIENGGALGAILWHQGGPETRPLLHRLLQKGIPLIFVDRYPDGMDCDYVGVDNLSGEKEVVHYLLRLGHRRIAYLMDNASITTVQERLEGYREALSECGVPACSELVYSLDAGAEGGMQAALAYFQALPAPPTAVVALNDLMAFAFMRAARDAGVRVPEDISVVGFDDIETYSPHPPMLTTVHQPFFHIGRRAADLLLRRLEPSAPPASGPYQHILLPTTLVVRSTCRALT